MFTTIYLVPEFDDILRLSYRYDSNEAKRLLFSSE